MRLLGHLYQAMWSNMWAPSIPTLLGIAYSHIRARQHREEKAREAREHAEQLAARPPGGTP